MTSALEKAMWEGEEKRLVGRGGIWGRGFGGSGGAGERRAWGAHRVGAAAVSRQGQQACVCHRSWVLCSGAHGREWRPGV